jgi:hypothetical protein
MPWVHQTGIETAGPSRTAGRIPPSIATGAPGFPSARTPDGLLGSDVLLGYLVEPFFSLVLERRNGSALSEGVPGVDAALVEVSGQ